MASQNNQNNKSTNRIVIKATASPRPSLEVTAERIVDKSRSGSDAVMLDSNVKDQWRHQYDNLPAQRQAGPRQAGARQAGRRRGSLEPSSLFTPLQITESKLIESPSTVIDEPEPRQVQRRQVTRSPVRQAGRDSRQAGLKEDRPDWAPSQGRLVWLERCVLQVGDGTLLPALTAMPEDIRTATLNLYLKALEGNLAFWSIEGFEITLEDLDKS